MWKSLRGQLTLNSLNRSSISGSYFIVSFPLNRIVIYAVDIIFLFLKSLKNLLSEADSSGRWLLILWITSDRSDLCVFIWPQTLFSYSHRSRIKVNPAVLSLLTESRVLSYISPGLDAEALLRFFFFFFCIFLWCTAAATHCRTAVNWKCFCPMKFPLKFNTNTPSYTQSWESEAWLLPVSIKREQPCWDLRLQH